MLECCMTFFKQKIYGAIPEKNLIEDLVRIADKYKLLSVTKKKYSKHGKYSVRQFYNKFGSWNKALAAAGLSTWNNVFKISKDVRYIGDRLRFKVFKRDNFKCVVCGASPAIDEKTVLHVDHAVPVALGGETVYENLQTFCSRCNYGKGAE